MDKPHYLQVAVIRENECIGCTKCIQACPVDAIIGAARQMHTVLADECIACKLCISPCPVDCIEMISVPVTAKHRSGLAVKARQRVRARQQRLQASVTKNFLPAKTDVAAAIERMRLKT